MMNTEAFCANHYSMVHSMVWLNPLSYSHVSDMLAERGISVHRSTIYRWFIKYAPVLRKKLKKYQFIRAVSSWQLDETYVKVNGISGAGEICLYEPIIQCGGRFSLKHPMSSE